MLKSVPISELERKIVAVHNMNSYHEIVDTYGKRHKMDEWVFILSDGKLLIQDKNNLDRVKIHDSNGNEVREITSLPNKKINSVHNDIILYYSYDFSAIYTLDGNKVDVSDKLPWNRMEYVTMNNKHFIYSDLNNEIVVLDLDGNQIVRFIVPAEKINDVIMSDTYLFVNVNTVEFLLYDYVSAKLLFVYEVTPPKRGIHHIDMAEECSVMYLFRDRFQMNVVNQHLVLSSDNSQELPIVLKVV
jgi:hypothetical protein